MIARWALVLIVAAASVAGLRAQTVPTTFPDRPTDALINLDRVAQNVAERFQLYNRDIFQKLAADIGWLEGQAPSWPASENTEGFIRSISYTTASLQALLDGVRKDVIPVVETARRDIEINARQCRTMGGPSSVQVSVVTRDKSRNEVGGYEVWYARKAFENVESSFRRFERNSSPADRVFREAGFYILWVEETLASGAKRRGTRLDIEIGPDRSTRVDLNTP